MRRRLDEQLEELNGSMIKMGMLCEAAILEATQALLQHQIERAARVSEILDSINEKDREIENLCYRLLLQQQPVATDLRNISSALKMITDLHRVGEQAEDIADIVSLNSISFVPSDIPLKEMSDATNHMVTMSIDAYVSRDLKKARKVIEYDDVVDAGFREVREALVKMIRTLPENEEENSTEGAMIIDLLMIAKYLERIGDHAVRIAGWVTFSITGVREGKTKNAHA